MESVATSRWNFSGLLIVRGPDGWYGRTCLASCRSTEEGHLEPSSGGWGNSGTGGPIESWTLSTSEFHSGAVASSLSDILETGAVPQRYFLSATACRGILRRAEKRGKQLPPSLAAVAPCIDSSFGRLQGFSGQDANHGYSHLVACQSFGDGAIYDTGEVAAPLRTGTDTDNSAAIIAFVQNSRDEIRLFGGDGQTVGAVSAELGMKQQAYVSDGWRVRRFTPRETERLFGFPDDFTLVPYRKGMMADGPRYKMLGNSMAVPVVRWIGERIAAVDALCVRAREAA
jgi:hypothetical protein